MENYLTPQAPVVEKSSRTTALPAKNRPWARLIAFYLPQFHPIPENDSWWGPGFTEWTNAAKARRRYFGHYQPRVPADLGFYDLRLPETRLAQARMAEEYGIEGFCYYHYWFAGHRLLERPFEEVLHSGEPDFPFCLCWANGTWTGIWHGAPNRVLIEQTYPGSDDYKAHFAAVLPAFHDRRYIRVDGKVLFAVHLPSEIPDPKRFTDLWRELALKEGLSGIHFSGVSHDLAWMPQEHGFDSRIPHSLPPVQAWFPWRQPLRKVRTAIRQRLGIPTIYNYADAVRTMLPAAMMESPSFPCVVPNWDNTARSGARGRVLHGSTPALFAAHLRKALELLVHVQPERRIVFIKSWNEWAEGNYLEPDLRFGRQYLAAVRDTLQSLELSR
jgi:lipopolysaccharide biosynthesis protein